MIYPTLWIWQSSGSAGGEAPTGGAAFLARLRRVKLARALRARARRLGRGRRR